MWPVVIGCLVLLIFFGSRGQAAAFDQETGNTKNQIYTQKVSRLVRTCYQKYRRTPWIRLNKFIERSKAQEWIILDVRTRQERDVSVIPGAMSIDAFKAAIKRYKDKNILVYCTVGCRSGDYAQKLCKKGFKAFNLWGGILAWALDGREFVTPSGRSTRRAHVYGRKWNALPPDYQAVW